MKFNKKKLISSAKKLVKGLIGILFFFWLAEAYIGGLSRWGEGDSGTFVALLAVVVPLIGGYKILELFGKYDELKNLYLSQQFIESDLLSKTNEYKQMTEEDKRNKNQQIVEKFQQEKWDLF